MSFGRHGWEACRNTDGRSPIQATATANRPRKGKRSPPHSTSRLAPPWIEARFSAFGTERGKVRRHHRQILLSDQPKRDGEGEPRRVTIFESCSWLGFPERTAARDIRFFLKASFANGSATRHERGALLVDICWRCLVQSSASLLALCPSSREFHPRP